MINVNYGTVTDFYTETKTPIMAGMQTDGIGGNKLRKVGHHVVRTYFDTPKKDCFVGGRTIKKVFY